MAVASRPASHIERMGRKDSAASQIDTSDLQETAAQPASGKKTDTPSNWLSLGSCNGSHQSPIDIPESSAHYNDSLGVFTFTNYSDPNRLLTITNTGHTVEVAVGDGVSVSAGGLSSVYKAIAFHFHWGNGTSGSEHRLSGRQYPMEMHIVHTKAGMNLTEAKKEADGIAVLGFFIDVRDSVGVSRFGSLSMLLSQVSLPGTQAALNSSFSLWDLLSDVNRSEYFRYPGSLTTPTCDQSVIWTVFKNPIYVPRTVVQTFSLALQHNVSGDLEPIQNNFRPPQPLNDRQVQASFKMSSSANGTSTSTPQPITSLPSSGTIQATSILCVSLLLLYHVIC
ncbi:carbonic anhydrase 4-like [Mantella aurantiaca]